MTSGKAGERHILRVDTDATPTRCWEVKICWRGWRIEKYFTDAPFGGKGEALEAARLFCHMMLATISGREHAIWRRYVKGPEKKWAWWVRVAAPGARRITTGIRNSGLESILALYQ
jgi:hypothetical protein